MDGETNPLFVNETMIWTNAFPEFKNYERGDSMDGGGEGQEEGKRFLTACEKK